MSLMHCFLSTLNYGIRMGGGIGEFLPAQTFIPENRDAFYIRFFYDLSFFLILITILLNVVFGIIIDTFASLRTAASDQFRLANNECFICGLNRTVLERMAGTGFDEHQNHDHYVWNYLYFIIHLREVDETQMNGIESEIFKLLNGGENGWFPQHTSLRYEKFNKGSLNASQHVNEQALDKLEEKLDQAEDSIKRLEEVLDVN